MKKFLFFVALVFLVGSVAFVLLNGLVVFSLMRSPAAIENGLLDILPIGTSIVDVERFIELQQYEVLSASDAVGFESEDGVIGSAHIWVILGEFRSIWTITTVGAYFGFDESRRLIAIEVSKSKDGP